MEDTIVGCFIFLTAEMTATILHSLILCFCEFTDVK